MHVDDESTPLFSFHEGDGAAPISESDLPSPRTFYSGQTRPNYSSPPLSILFYLSLLDLSLLQVYTQVRIPYNMEWGVDELLVGWTCIHSTLCCASFAIEHAVSLMVYITLHQYKESNLCYYTPFILIITFEPINSVKFPQYLLVSV